MKVKCQEYKFCMKEREREREPYGHVILLGSIK